MRNGTYVIPLRELYKESDFHAIEGEGEQSPSPGASSSSGGLAEPVEKDGGADDADMGLGGRDLSDPRDKQPDDDIVTHNAPEKPPIKVIRAPHQPTQGEIDEHNAAGHWPFRSWCPTCVAASAPDDPHRNIIEPPGHEFPIFSSDYAFLGTKDQNDKLTLFIVKEHKSKHVFSTVVPRKGSSETTVAIEFYLECVAELGFQSTTIYTKNDQEPALAVSYTHLRAHET